MGRGRKAAQSQVEEGLQARPRSQHSSTDRVGAATAPAAAASRQQGQQRPETRRRANTAAHFQDQAEGGASSSITAMPWEIMLELVQHMDSRPRSQWRLVNKAACQAVYEGTTALAPSSTALKTEIYALPQPLLRKCRSLEQLSCRALGLRSIQGLPPRLRVLDVSETLLTDLSPLGRCTGLRQLSANNLPGFMEIAQLAAALLQLTGLQQLALHGAALTHADISFLAPALQGMAQLQHLDLTNNCMGDEGARALAPALQRLTRLQRLGLSCTMLGPAGITALAPYIKQLKALQRLDLSCNYNLLDAEAAQALALALMELTGLQELELTGCDLTALTAQALAPAIKALPRLKVQMACREQGVLDEALAL